MTESRKACLSYSEQKLVEMMQRLNFGRIEALVIRNGQPVLDPPPRVVREIKLAGANGPRPELRSEDFCLKTEVVEMFKQFRRLADGTVESVEVKHGLPFLMVVADPR